jgi:hypothetical protein
MNGGQGLEGAGARQNGGAAEAFAAGENVVKRETYSIEGKFPVLIGGDDEGSGVGEVRGVAEHPAAFLEGLQNEFDVALLEIAYPSMDEFGAAAGGGFGEVPGFEE